MRMQLTDDEVELVLELRKEKEIWNGALEAFQLRARDFFDNGAEALTPEGIRSIIKELSK